MQASTYQRHLHGLALVRGDVLARVGPDEREVSGRQAIRCRTASVRSARPKSAPARQAALLRPFGVTDFSGLAMSASNVLAMKVFGMSERA